ncbi:MULTISPECIES: 8-amino-7-oxononanoate synthase [Sphingobacterium]|uniref:8-amino-7-oxononanoate synthase n=1 Tax=Sphingobacterium TaxID=28453 RepID=UPI00257E7615|nr:MULTISPECIES: 8-amino-7-oxononanoate synthase [Sphingobacterium]
MSENSLIQRIEDELFTLEKQGNIRKLPLTTQQGKAEQEYVNAHHNLSSNDYLGLATDQILRQEFLNSVTKDNAVFSASSSRLLTGNHAGYTQLETTLCRMFGTESALVFNSGYHMNVGILPAVCDTQTLILADKGIHASLIDGIRLSNAACYRYRHSDYTHLTQLLAKYAHRFTRIIIVTESIFSMDGDCTDLHYLVSLKQRYPNTLLYVDEAHAVGVRGIRGLGCAEEQHCITDIDFLTGTFGKALASLGGYLLCKEPIRNYLINKARTLVFTTALPPINLLWTAFILERLSDFTDRRQQLHKNSLLLQQQIIAKGFNSPSESHILPVIIGDNKETILKAEDLQRKRFYVLPIRPPTVPEGTSRIRLSLTATMTSAMIKQLAASL